MAIPRAAKDAIYKAMGMPKYMATKKAEMEKGMQNYGYNIAKNIAKGQEDLKAKRISSSTYINPFPNPLKKSSYRK